MMHAMDRNRHYVVLAWHHNALVRCTVSDTVATNQFDRDRDCEGWEIVCTSIQELLMSKAHYSL